MKIIRGIEQMVSFIDKHCCRKIIGFVPTMGALHEGHLSLIRRAAAENDLVVVSIFVNPTQFGQNEDFKIYPRALEKDAVLCRKSGVDVIFYPDAKAMYPPGYKTYVEVNGLSDILCGKFRPGHFRGVATIVVKLLNIVRPDSVYFGQKDAQQAAIIQKMVKDLNMEVEVRVLPTVRAKNGLALSSRNTYLSPKELQDALVLPCALNLAKDLVKSGTKDPKVIARKMRLLIQQKPNVKIDYIAVVDNENLQSLQKVRNGCLIALAVRVGKTRLIDNLIVKSKVKSKKEKPQFKSKKF